MLMLLFFSLYLYTNHPRRYLYFLFTGPWFTSLFAAVHAICL